MKAAAITATPVSHASPQSWPALFILLWSSGYVAGKIALPYAGPLTLIFLRFGVAALVLLLMAVLTRAPWPKDWASVRHLAVVGLLIQALQFSGLYLGLSWGVSAGIAALIVGLMPVLTAAGAAMFLNERISRQQLGGLMLGLLGVGIVVAHKVGAGQAPWLGYLALGAALLGITAGTLLQKKYCAGMDLRTGGFIQLCSATLVVGPAAWLLERLQLTWTWQLVGASLWLSLVNSIGAISVLFIMMRRGQASQVASLFYLVPGVTALMGYLLLHETLNATQLLGFLVSAGGVYLTTAASRFSQRC
ncbi:DMT family transporter [Roseateles sp. BYS180W]|uniref:DMT family transporter n=1 Tax=Roseateles rivi TaxID=3299028 RepID=A0ABW7FTN9_9BURK